MGRSEGGGGGGDGEVAAPHWLSRGVDVQDVRPACTSRAAAATATPPRDRVCPILCLYLGQPRTRARTPQRRTSSLFPHLHPHKPLLLRLLSLFSGHYFISFVFLEREKDRRVAESAERPARKESFHLSCSQGVSVGGEWLRIHFSGEAEQLRVNTRVAANHIKGLGCRHLRSLLETFEKYWALLIASTICPRLQHREVGGFFSAIFFFLVFSFSLQNKMTNSHLRYENEEKANHYGTTNETAPWVSAAR